MNRKSILDVSIVFIGLIGLTGCNGKWNGEEWIQGTDVARQAVLVAIPAAPYQKVQHDALKAYFERSETLLQLFDEEPKAVQRFNEFLSKQDFESVCAKTLLNGDAWREAMSHCQKNNYFLCTEAVRAYPGNVRKLREALTRENQRRFDESAECNAGRENVDGA